jgi:MraZ protein
MIFRQFVADVEEINIDSNGRILIPKRYLKMAGITQEVRFIGMDDTIEIWAKEKLEQPFMDAATFGNEIEKVMSEKQKEEHNNV